MYVRKSFSMDFSTKKCNNEIINLPFDLHKKVQVLCRELDCIDRMKVQHPSNTEPSAIKLEQYCHALGLHNITESMLKKVEPLVKHPGYIVFLEGYHKTLQELKIKFLLKSIIENPLDWEDYGLCCEIYDGLMIYYHSARCTLSQCDLTYQNISLKNIQRFLAVFKYNFAYSLAYNAVRAPEDINNFHYYSAMKELTAQGLDKDLCHKIVNQGNALRIAQESYLESETTGMDNDLLVIHLKREDAIYREMTCGHSADIGR
jgi:hypothetical protein